MRYFPKTIENKIGLTLGLTHFLAVVLFATYLHNSSEAQIQLLWTLWIPIDFPISMLVSIGYDTIRNTVLSGSLFQAWLPHIAHGVLGSLWWYCIPFIFVRIVNIFKSVGSNE